MCVRRLDGAHACCAHAAAYPPPGESVPVRKVPYQPNVADGAYDPDKNSSCTLYGGTNVAQARAPSGTTYPGMGLSAPAETGGCALAMVVRTRFYSAKGQLLRWAPAVSLAPSSAHVSSGITPHAGPAMGYLGCTTRRHCTAVMAKQLPWIVLPSCRVPCCAVCLFGGGIMGLSAQQHCTSVHSQHLSTHGALLLPLPSGPSCTRAKAARASSATA